jgi:hypothetical protein
LASASRAAPGEKINHSLVLAGAQGIGKDIILEPVKYAVGAWNFTEIAASHMLGRFNGFVKSVILRVSEARDLGDGGASPSMNTQRLTLQLPRTSCAVMKKYSRARRHERLRRHHHHELQNGRHLPTTG